MSAKPGVRIHGISSYDIGYIISLFRSRCFYVFWRTLENYIWWYCLVEATDLSPDLENRLLARNVFSDGMLSNIRQAKNRLVFISVPDPWHFGRYVSGCGSVSSDPYHNDADKFTVKTTNFCAGLTRAAKARKKSILPALCFNSQQGGGGWKPALAVLRIRDVYTGSRILIFTHPGSRIQKQQQITFFFVATNFTKLKIILFLKCWRIKFGPVFKEL